MLRLDGRRERKMSTGEAEQFCDDVLRESGRDGLGITGPVEITLGGMPYTLTIRYRFMGVAVAGGDSFASLDYLGPKGIVSTDGREDSPQGWDDFVDRMGW